MIRINNLYFVKNHPPPRVKVDVCDVSIDDINMFAVFRWKCDEAWTFLPGEGDHRGVHGTLYQLSKCCNLPCEHLFQLAPTKTRMVAVNTHCPENTLALSPSVFLLAPTCLCVKALSFGQDLQYRTPWIMVKVLFCRTIPGQQFCLFYLEDDGLWRARTHSVLGEEQRQVMQAHTLCTFIYKAPLGLLPRHFCLLSSRKVPGRSSTLFPMLGQKSGTHLLGFQQPQLEIYSKTFSNWRKLCA